MLEWLFLFLLSQRITSKHLDTHSHFIRQLFWTCLHTWPNNLVALFHVIQCCNMHLGMHAYEKCMLSPPQNILEQKKALWHFFWHASAGARDLCQPRGPLNCAHSLCAHKHHPWDNCHHITSHQSTISGAGAQCNRTDWGVNYALKRAWIGLGWIFLLIPKKSITCGSMQ